MGVTSVPSPTLYYFLSGESAVPVEITLIDGQSIDPLVEIHIDPPISAGLHAIELGAHGAALEPATSYQWLVALVTDAERRENDQIASAGVRYVPLDADGLLALETGPVAERAHHQARLGYWYDAFATLEGWREVQREVVRLLEFEEALLEQVDLVEVAAGLDADEGGRPRASHVRPAR
jgi:hypothetical protein